MTFTIRLTWTQLGGGLGLRIWVATVYEDGVPIREFRASTPDAAEEQAQAWIEDQAKIEEDVIIEDTPVIEYDTPPPPPPGDNWQEEQGLIPPADMGREADDDWESMLREAIRDPSQQNFYDAVAGQSYNEWEVSREYVAVYEADNGAFIIILPRPEGSGYIMAYLYTDTRPPEWTAPVVWVDRSGRERTGALNDSELQEMMEWAEARGTRVDKTTSAFIEGWQNQSGESYNRARITLGESLTQEQIDELKAAGLWNDFEAWVQAQIDGFSYELSENGRYAQLWQTWVIDNDDLAGGMNIIAQEGGQWKAELWKEWGEAGKFPSWAYERGSAPPPPSPEPGPNGGTEDDEEEGAWDWRTLLDEEHGKVTAFGGIVVAGLLIFVLTMVLRRRGDGK